MGYAGIDTRLDAVIALYGKLWHWMLRVKVRPTLAVPCSCVLLLSSIAGWQIRESRERVQNEWDYGTVYLSVLGACSGVQFSGLDVPCGTRELS